MPKGLETRASSRKRQEVEDEVSTKKVKKVKKVANMSVKAEPTVQITAGGTVHLKVCYGARKEQDDSVYMCMSGAMQSETRHPKKPMVAAIVVSAFPIALDQLDLEQEINRQLQSVDGMQEFSFNSNDYDIMIPGCEETQFGTYKYHALTTIDPASYQIDSSRYFTVVVVPKVSDNSN
jgi:hypothetical protein